MAVKLFVSDIDGTLLVPGQSISAKNIAAVKKMVAAGITVTIATGRMYRAGLPIAQELGVNVPIITYNGALIKSAGGEVIHVEYLPADLIVEIVKFFERHDWYLQSYSGDEVIYPFENEFSRQYETSQKVKGAAVGWAGLCERTERVCKLLSISSGAAATAERMAAVRAEFGGRIEITKSHPQFVEMMCLGVSKASAVKILAKKLNIDRAEVMAIGDSDNDLPMLQAAGKSIAMGNAVDAVKNSCDFVTGNCEDDGFAEAVAKYVLKEDVEVE